MSRLTAAVSLASALALGTGALEAQSRAAYQSIDTIRVDSLMREAPVSTLSELLNSRIPGLHVTQNESVIGGEIGLGIRTPSSLYAGTEPLVFVDGARYTAAGWLEPNPGGAAQAGASRPLNDLDPNDIELIEVIRGPSAAALYGAGSGNGVILITTKRGQPGRPRWHVHARRRMTSRPHVPELNSHIAWGHDFSSSEPVHCTLDDPTCTIDSLVVGVSSLDALRATNDIAGWTYGGNVAGGSDRARYYLGANVDDASSTMATAPLAGGGVVSDQGVTRINLRANATAQLGRRAEIRLQSGYLHGSIDNTDGLPLAREWGERTRRWLGSLVGTFHPAPWLSTHATLGYDHGRRTRATVRWAIGTTEPTALSAGYDTVRQRNLTAAVSAIATAATGRLTARTAVGLDYTGRQTEMYSAIGSGLPPGQHLAGSRTACLDYKN